MGKSKENMNMIKFLRYPEIHLIIYYFWSSILSVLIGIILIITGYFINNFEVLLWGIMLPIIPVCIFVNPVPMNAPLPFAFDPYPSDNVTINESGILFNQSFKKEFLVPWNNVKKIEKKHYPGKKAKILPWDCLNILYINDEGNEEILDNELFVSKKKYARVKKMVEAHNKEVELTND